MYEINYGIVFTVCYWINQVVTCKFTLNYDGD